MKACPNDLAEQPDWRDPQVRLSRLTPYFPPHLVQSAIVKAGKPSIGTPQFFNGTVLIADLKGFSAQSALLFELDRQNDDVLRALVNRYFGVVLKESRRFGGSPFSFDGDALSILFYGPRHAEVAVAAAFAIQEAVKRTVAHLLTGDVTLQASLGLSSGRLLSASLGVEGALVCTLLGQTATQAVGAQKVAVGSQIIATESTLSALTFEVAAQPVPHGFYAIDVDRSWFEPIVPSPSSLVEPDARHAAWVATYLMAHFPPGVTHQLLHGDIRPDYRNIAVLFVNVDGLGELISKRGLDAVPELNHFFGGLLRIVDRHGGLLNKVNSYYVGDKCLILFGLSALPCADPESAALHTAFELQAWANEAPFLLKQRVGFSAGWATECVVGNQWRREFTVIGQPVNEAVHLMELAKWGEIAALGDFCQDVQSDGWIVRPERALLKGYAQKVMVYRFSRGGGGSKG